MELAVEYIVKFISSFIMMSVIVNCWHKLIGEKINLKDKKMYITIVILSLISIFNYYLVNQYIRIFSITLFLVIAFYVLFKKKLSVTILTPIFVQFIFMIVEMIFVVTVCQIFNMNNEGIIDTQFGQFFSNFVISMLVLMVFKIPFINKFYNIIIKATDKINNKQIIITSFIVIIMANLLTMLLYYKIEFKYLLIFNTLLTIFCFTIVIYSFKTKNNYIKVYDKYNTTLKNLKEYEDILDRYRVSNHENKNQLLTIRNMLPKTNKKIISYIDTVVENKLKDNERVMFEVSRIPAGGLRGLIYSKVLAMKEINVDYELEISKEVKTVDLINNIDESMMLDICKIIGVYLDNAIQEVEKLYEKYVNIEMYLDNKDLIIAISNNYNEIIEIDKIEEKGYTTKENGHGYGLTLARGIIESNKKLSNKKMITQDTFTQMLKIKM